MGLFERKLFSSVNKWKKCIILQYFNLHQISVSKTKYKILFFGSDAFSLPSLKMLNNEFTQKGLVSNLEVVISSKRSDILSYCRQNSLKVHQWPLLIQKNEFELGVVVSFGHLIPKSIIDGLPLGILNVHGSLLPRWRGASPVTHAILHGDSITGITIMKIAPHYFDIGRILNKKSVKIGRDVKTAELLLNLSIVGATVLKETLSNLEFYESNSSEQCGEVTLAKKLYKTMGNVKWEGYSCFQVYNLWRALSDMYALYSNWSGQLKIYLDQPIYPGDIDQDYFDKRCPHFAPGEVFYAVKQKNVLIKCKVGWIAFKFFRPERKRLMTCVEFYSGYVGPKKIIQPKFLFVAD